MNAETRAYYLLKPLSEEKVGRCMEKALERRRPERFVTLHGAGEILKVSEECINYVEARGRGCCIGRVKVPEVLQVRESLSELESLLDPEEFMKCHRSYLCRIGSIRQIGRDSVEFDDRSSIFCQQAALSAGESKVYRFFPPAVSVRRTPCSRKDAWCRQEAMRSF